MHVHRIWNTHHFYVVIVLLVLCVFDRRELPFFLDEELHSLEIVRAHEVRPITYVVFVRVRYADVVVP